MRARPDLVALIAVLVVVAGLVGLTWLNLSLGARFPGGNGLVPYWGAARVYLFQGASPYGIGAAQFIERIGVNAGLQDVGVFNGPFFLLLPFMPLALIEDFQLARAIWMALLEVSALLVVFFTFQILNWRLSLFRYALFALFALGWVHTVVPLVHGDGALLAAALLLATIPAMQVGRYRLTATLLAVALLKPFTAPLFLVFLLLRAVSRSGGRVLRDIALLYGVLGAFSFLLRPNWLLEWGQVLVGRGEWGVPVSVQALLIDWFPNNGRFAFYVLAALAAGMIMIAWLNAARKGHQGFLWAAMVTIALTPLTGIPVALAGYVLMLAPLTLVFMIWERRWAQAGYWLTYAIQLALLVGLWALLGDLGERGLRALPEVFVLIVPLYLAITLTWGRWWALEPARLPYETLRRRLEEL